MLHALSLADGKQGPNGMANKQKVWEDKGKEGHINFFLVITTDTELLLLSSLILDVFYNLNVTNVYTLIWIINILIV